MINNAKYSIITFIPMVLYRQFQHFFNLYFLCLTITQFVPALKVGNMMLLIWRIHDKLRGTIEFGSNVISV